MGLREHQRRLQHTCIVCRGLRALFCGKGDYLDSLLSDTFILEKSKCIILLLIVCKTVILTTHNLSIWNVLIIGGSAGEGGGGGQKGYMPQQMGLTLVIFFLNYL